MTRLLAFLAVLAASPVSALDLAPPVNLCAVAERLAPEMERLTGRSAGQACPAVSFTLPAITTDRQSRAGAYNFDTREIALAADLDLTSVYGQSILLHEMIHAAQHRDGHDPACRAELEYEAYMAQAAFLRDHGEEREAQLALIFAAMLSGCGPRYE